MKKLLRPEWAIFTLLALVYVFAVPSNFIESIKLNYFDALITNEEPVENNIYVAQIDEDTLELHGQYPFPRYIYGDIIMQLYEQGAGLVVWNIMMPEEGRFGGDEYLEDVLLEYPVVLASRPSNNTKNEPINPGAVIINPEYLDTILPYNGIIANIPILENASVGAGIVSTEPEIDGVVRRMPTVAMVNGVLYPSLALETLRVIASDPSFQIKLQPNGIEKMRIPQFGVIPTDNEGRVWIDWSQRNKTFSIASLPDDFLELNGAIVIVDVVAAGIANPVPTAMGSKFAGETQATVLATMFAGTNIQRPDWAPQLEIMAVALCGILLIVLSHWMMVGLLTTVVLLCSIIPYSMYMYTTEKILLDATAPVITLIIVALHVYGIKFIREFLEKQQIKKQFEHYLDPRQVKALQKNPELLKLGGERKEMSFLFMDIIGFTPISEYYKNKDDPEGLVVLVNEFLDEMTNIILANGGMVDKFMGDCIMAVYNAPIDMPNHAEMAVKSAIEIEAKTIELKGLYKERGLPDINVGTGVNTGTAIIGNMGSTTRFDFSVIGDAVNLAARLEATAGRGAYKNHPTIYSSMTMEQLPDNFKSKKIGDIKVKGKDDVITIYSPHILALSKYK